MTDKGGRPSKFNQEIADKILASIREGATATLAAKKARITYRTLRNWLKEGEDAQSGKKREFFLDYREALADAEQIWVDRLHQEDTTEEITYDKDDQIIRRKVVKRNRGTDPLRVLKALNPYDYDRTFSDEELIERYKARYGDKWKENLYNFLEASEASLEEC